MLAIDSGIVYDNPRHLSKTYQRKPEEQLNIRFKKEGKLYGALNTRPYMLVSSRDFESLI